MVFRREKQVDSFQRQMSALRQRLGDGTEIDPNDVNGDLPDYDDRGYADDVDNVYGGEQALVTGESGGYSFGDYDPQNAGDVIAEDPNGLAVPEMPNVDNQISVVAPDTLWKGDLESEGSLHVYGRVEGSLTAKDDIWIAEGATVEATLTARRVVVAGNVNGNITASERFEALPQGKVSADVSAPTFVVHEGAKINGQLKMAQAEGTTAGSYDRAGSLSVVQRRARSGS